MNKKSPAAASKPRRRGRPPKAASPLASEPVLSRAAIIKHAYNLTKTIPLADISIVQLAKDLGVAPGLIHYYVGGRDKLISGVVNLYYRTRVEQAPSLTGNWREDVEAIAWRSFEVTRENPGISLYIASHNKHRLFQDVEPGETDYGMVYFNRVTSAFLQGGFSPRQVALAFHLFAQFLVSAGMAEAGRQLPAHHQSFILAKLRSFPHDLYPAAHVVSEEFASLSSDVAFAEGLKLLLDGFSGWPREQSDPTAQD